MKKLLGMTLALAMFVPAGANAELLKNFKFGGNLDIQTTSARNVTDFVTRPAPTGSPANNDRIGAAVTRVILKLDWDLLDDVHSRITLSKGASNNTASQRAYGTGSQDLNAVQSAVFVQEANVKIDKVFGLVDLTAGRQFYGEEGDLIIYYGPRDNYGLSVTAVDLFRADWNGEHMAVTGIAGKTASGSTSANPGDTDLRGVTVSCKMHEMVKPAVYVYNQVAHATGGLGSTTGKNTNLWVIGAKAKFVAGGLNASAEVAKNFGEDRTNGATNNTSYKGYALLGKVAYKLDIQDAAAITPWGEFGWGTGDSNGSFNGNRNFQSVATDYRPGGIYGRFIAGSPESLGSAVTGFSGNTNGLSNRIIWGLGVKATPSALNKLTAGVAFYRYAFDRLALNANGTRNSRNIGSEVDVTAEWKHSENVSLKATAGSFKPGAYVADVKGANAALNPAVMLAGDVAIKW